LKTGHRVISVPTGRFDGRSYILLDETKRAVVVDPDINANEILRVLQAEEAKTEYILLTHGHYDHMSSSDIIREKTGAKAAIHRLDIPALSDPRLNMSGQFDQTQIRGRQVDVVLEEGSIITAGDIEIKVFHTPGHTPGSCCFLAGGGLFTGDTLFRGSYGTTAFPGGDTGALMLSAARLLSLDKSLCVYPGHGGPTTIAGSAR